MMRKPVKARGEVAIKVAGKDLILCATMANLDALQEQAECKTLSALMTALAEHDFKVLKAAFTSLAIEGDADAAWSDMIGVSEMPVIQRAVMDALVPDKEDDAGNAKGAPEKR
jgi:hypothetical protein